jgi:hypothetical protein
VRKACARSIPALDHEDALGCSDDSAAGQRLLELVSVLVFVGGRHHDRRVSGPHLTTGLRPVIEGNRGADIDRALRVVTDEAVAKKAPLVEIIPGKGSGALKKHVLRFLDQKENRALSHRVEKDVDNHGRIFVHFRWEGPARHGGEGR